MERRMGVRRDAIRGETTKAGPNGPPANGTKNVAVARKATPNRPKNGRSFMV